MELTQQSKKILIVIGILIILGGVFYFYQQNTSQEEDFVQLAQDSKEEIEKEKEEEKEILILHIAGEVNEPGIIKIEEGARIADLIEKAGGLTQQADLTQVNLAYEVEDGQKIVIPNKNETKEEQTESVYITKENGENIIGESKEQKGEGKMININLATQEELQQLQGIGEATANKIIQYRTENGKFGSIEDLKKVSGIGEAKYNAIKDNITV